MIEPPRHPGRASMGSPLANASAGRVGALAVVVLAAIGALAAARPPLHVPRDPKLIKLALDASNHVTDCAQCHSEHGDDPVTVYPNALTSPNDNALCARCHTPTTDGGSWFGDGLYRGTGHGSSTAMVWPGPTPPVRVEPDAATKCLNCHDPHGFEDAQGPIPMLGLRREEQLCLQCHDGSPATTDIASDLRKPYRHPVADVSGMHSGSTESDPQAFGVSPVNRRHAECEDCHNPHVSRADRSGVPGDDEASKTTLGVSRVTVLNGAAGTRPLYGFVSGADTLTAPVAEYQLCFKCHSSWTTQPAGQTDQALALNPANPSYHPVEAPGRNPMIAASAFTPGWSASSMTRCGSCHGSDFGSAAGPHGSANAFLLRKPSQRSSATRTMGSDELCFECHAYDVYGTTASPVPTRAASRFNAPGTADGHAEHVGDLQVPCFACHETHGSATQPFLLATSRSPGLISYTQTPTGGTCTSTCHGVQSYTINYAR